MLHMVELEVEFGIGFAKKQFTVNKLLVIEVQERVEDAFGKQLRSKTTLEK